MNDERNKVTVVLADDHALFREGIAEIIAAEGDITVVGQAASGRTSSSWTSRCRGLAWKAP